MEKTNESNESAIIRAIQAIQHSGGDTLSLVGRQLFELPYDLFAGCSKIKFINLSYNKLTILPACIFKYFTNILSINLSANKLIELPADLFSGCLTLQYVHLSHNQLTKLPSGLFTGCSRLRIVTFDNNPLTELPHDLFAECPKLNDIGFNKALVYHVLWSLPNFDDDDDKLMLDLFEHGIYSKKFLYDFRVECALIKKCRRIADDPRSYAWSVRRYAIVG